MRKLEARLIKNLGDLTPQERAAMDEERKLAFERHQAAKALEIRAQVEYDRIMKERIWKPHSWRLRWVQLVDDIDDSELREAVRKKVFAFIESIGGREAPRPRKT